MKSNDLKPLARKYHQAVSNYDSETIASMITDEYIQHNPKVPTGKQAFLDLIPILEKHQAKIENYRMLQDGRFIIMHHKWINATPMGGDTLCAFHIIRFDEEDLIAEHWNVASSDLDLEGDREVKDFSLTQENKNLVKDMVKDKKVQAIFGEGNFVLSICEGEIEGANCALYDLYQIEKAKVVKSWKIYQPIPTTDLANSNTMFNFPFDS